MSFTGSVRHAELDVVASRYVCTVHGSKFRLHQSNLLQTQVLAVSLIQRLQGTLTIYRKFAQTFSFQQYSHDTFGLAIDMMLTKTMIDDLMP